VAEQQGSRGRTIAILIGALFVVVAFAQVAATFYTDWLWFQELDQTGVFWTARLSLWITGLVFAVVFFAIVYANVLIARRFAPKRLPPPVYIEGQPQDLEQVVGRVREATAPILRWLLFGVTAVMAVFVGAALAEEWPVLQLALNTQPFGVDDPQFGMDVGFYVFTLPALRLIADFLFWTLIVALVGSFVVHVLDGAVRPRARMGVFAPHVKAHLSALAALVLLAKAFDYYLDIFELNFSPRGQVLGASYTDVNAQLPALWILLFIAIGCAVALLVNIRLKGWRLPIVTLGVLFVASFALGVIWPAAVQQFRVEPNEVAAEAPYIERNITATRAAFGLDDVTVEPFPATEALTTEDIVENRVTIENVRLWDPNVVVESYKQLQEIRLYYEFYDVDVDRYTIDDEYDQVLISGREMAVEQLDDRAQTWVNQHLFYTHGYGAVVSPVNLADTNGYPSFIVKDIPPQTDTDLEIDQSRLYYGEGQSNYVVAPSGLDEFDYPTEEQEPAKNNYDGEGGVPTGSLGRRLAFALRFGTTRMLLSEFIQDDSRTLFNRTLEERIGELAPWLWLDGDPYLAIIDGRLTWIVDGYTYTSMFPYSQPLATGGFNYMRNSVKATVDAYDGTTTIYAFDEEDPVLAAWGEVFPDLLTPAEEMPEEVRLHLRYPEDLFRIQAEVYKTYHMLDPNVFYNKEDQWEIPGERREDGEVMLPYYVLMRLPGADSEEFILMQPFTPRNKDNMIGWMAAGCDPENYGRRLVYTFPKGELVFGPEQVSARINQEPEISQQLSLWNQRGSGVLFGNMLVIPIEESVVFVQPLYLRAEETPIPQLTRVIVAFGDRVAMEPDLPSALIEVFGIDEDAEEVEVEAGVETDEEAAVEATEARALELYEAAIEAQREGDWAEYGRLVDELGIILAELAGVEATASAEATPTP
jgi:uncharacterized membrane protein (UPF0182 family)